MRSSWNHAQTTRKRMMATEATSDNIADSSTLPNHELSTTEPTIQDVQSDETHPLVNGTSEKDEIKQDNAEPTEAGAISAEVSVSGGSDTEATKAETSKNSGEEKGHVRSTSTVKKFTSFKPVSVNKTFLAAKGTTTASPLKPGEKPATGTTAAQPGPLTTAPARPRLVAKSGSGLRDSSPRSATAANSGKPGAAPDASAVWNKNRPAPPPEPKRLTDEELKQQYGIHLTARLQADEGEKKANWADIDEDEDDWAPDQFSWNDGTKLTVPVVDETPVVAPAPSLSPSPAVQEAKDLEATKPMSPAPTQAAASPTVRPSGFGGRAGLVLKGASEKPTLVAKPPGPPTPVKSPWAPLPPVDKVAPIAIDIPQNQNQQQQRSRFDQRDPHGFHGMPPPPAKEIAADDFSRSWRDGPNTSRELYNSQSGRYEPVNDNRRGSRNDVHSRQPAVLQRPQQDGPAEPSPAFQTHRASGQDGSYGRRRTSSNVSGGSGNVFRRMSRGLDMPPPHEMVNARRGSLAAVSDEAASPRNFSPSGQYQNQRGYQNQPWSRASPVVSHPSPQSVHGQTIPPASAGVQGLPVPQEDPIEEQKVIMKLRREEAIKRRQEQEAQEEAAKKERIRLKLEAMERKLGALPDTKKKDAPKDEKVVPTQIQTRDSTETVDSHVDVSAVNNEPSPNTNEAAQTKLSHEPKQIENRSSNQDSRANGPNGYLGGAASSTHVVSLQESRSTPSWQSNSAANADRFHSWGPAPAQQSSSRNVWGPPSADRTLGNGTFNPELSMAAGNVGPIGPPNRGNGGYQQGRGSRPAPIGPPNRATSGPPKEQQDPRIAGWVQAPEKIAQEDAEFSKKAEAELAHRREQREKGLYAEPSQPLITDNWKQTAINEDGTRGKIIGVSVNIINGDGSIHKKENERRQFDGQSQFSNDPWRSTSNAPPQVRGSRFFPNNRDARLDDPSFFERPGSPSPPPPTTDDHPAYDGVDKEHPHVSLPKPAPVVKLPPPVLAPIGPPKPATFAAAVTAPAAPPTNYHRPQDYNNRQTGFQDVRLQPSAGGWQDKISNLLGRKSSPPKSALAVDSSSKHALELPTTQSFATVSLPSSVTGDLAADDASVASKPASVECFEEQEMGSLPPVKLPFIAPANGWTLAAPPPKALPKKFLLSNATSIDAIHFPQQFTNNGLTVIILLPGQQESKSVSVATHRQRSNPRRGGGSRGTPRHTSSSHPRGGRARDSPSGFASPSLENDSGTPSPSSRGGHRASGRGYGSNWNRHVSTPVHT